MLPGTGGGGELGRPGADGLDKCSLAVGLLEGIGGGANGGGAGVCEVCFRLLLGSVVSLGLENVGIFGADGGMMLALLSFWPTGFNLGMPPARISPS